MAETDGLVYEVCRMYFEDGLSVTDIGKQLTANYPARDANKWREQIYPMLREGFKREFIQLNPPVDEALSHKIKERLHDRGVDLGTREIRFVDTDDERGNDRVPLAAAHWALELMRHINK